jgi:hypothetical protein
MGDINGLVVIMVLAVLVDEFVEVLHRLFNLAVVCSL